MYKKQSNIILQKFCHRNIFPMNLGWVIAPKYSKTNLQTSLRDQQTILGWIFSGVVCVCKGKRKRNKFQGTIFPLQVTYNNTYASASIIFMTLIAKKTIYAFRMHHFNVYITASKGQQSSNVAIAQFLQTQRTSREINY